MISADEFLGPAAGAGFDFFTGVPCSLLTPLINRVIADDSLAYVPAASEGEAVGIAAGAWLAGRKTVVMCQNSGLGNTVNPLTSLNFPFRIPTLLIVTWRGAPGLNDEPQHELMGEVTQSLLDVIRVPHAPFPTDLGQVAQVLARAESEMERTGLPFALIMEKGDVASEELNVPAAVSRPRARLSDLRAGEGEAPARFDVLQRLLASLPDEAAVVATTGKCGRELFTLADRPQHLYQVGSMGCASATGLGVALNARRPVVVLDGDGAALMKMGAMATIGAMAPSNLIHLVLDNGTYDSTGGQPTVSPHVDFAALGVACGYGGAFSCDSLEGLERALGQALSGGGPHFIHMPVAPGSRSALGRPTVKPPEVALRFKEFLSHQP